MSKEYVFEFQGTKEMFFDILKQFHNSDGKFFYFNDYIVELSGDEIRFGIERCGHSGGYWFISVINEFDNRIEFRGTVQYVGSNIKEDQGAIKKTIDKSREILLFILLLPIALIFKLYTIVEWCIRKVSKQTKKKTKTKEDKLYDLMENYLNCIRI